MDLSDVELRVATVSQLFSDDYRFHLPWFQRAYAWHEEHAGRLLVDVKTAIDTEQKRYCLGHIRLAKLAGQPESALIDGQQRAITLTILAALLRDMRPGTPEAARLDRLIRPLSPAGPPTSFRLTPQPLLQTFLSQYVQAPGATLIEPAGDIMSLAESERTILANRNHMRGVILDQLPGDADQLRFATYLLENCFLFVIAVEDEEEAWSMLATEEETGLMFHSSERSKLSIISVMPRYEQEAASNIWAHCQGIVGSDDLSALLCHIRALKLKKRSSKPVEKDLAQSFSLDKTGLTFMKQELQARAETYLKIRNGHIGDEATRQAIAPALESLWWMGHQLWMPPALQWLATHGETHAETARFLFELDRLNFVLNIAGTDPNDKERRFHRVVTELSRQNPLSKISSLQIEPKLGATALANLRSRTFYIKHYSHLVLRKLMRMLGADPGPMTREITIEHVLPRRPLDGSSWWREFRDPDTVANYANRLGNLVLLSQTDNQRAGTADFADKRRVFAASGQRLAVDLAASHETWSRRAIEARTEALIGVISGYWALKP